MANLAELAAAAHSLSVPQNHTILIYGDPKSGKTRLAATLSKITQVRRVYFFDGENGSDTLITMARRKELTAEEAEKITLFKITDTPDHPYFIETILKAFFPAQGRSALSICTTHGRVECPFCLQKKLIGKANWEEFDILSLGHDDWVVIDTGSQLAASAMESVSKGFAYTTKLGFDEYGPQGRMLTDILTLIQAAQTNFCMITHQVVLKGGQYEEEGVNSKGEKTVKKAYLDNEPKYYPLVGTRAFSLNVAKYFGTIIYTDMRLRKHVAGSSSTYNSEMITGSRLGIAIEKAGEADLSLVLPQAGLYPLASNTNTETQTNIPITAVKSVLINP